MARKRALDFLVDFRFHLFDVQPTLGVPPLVFNPGIGFSGISAPSMSMEKGTISPGNSYYAHKYIRRGSIGTIVLTRGATLSDSDFWRWFIAALTGSSGGLNDIPGNRRTLLLVHFGTSDTNSALSDFASRAARLGDTLSQAGSLATFGNLPSFALLGQIPSRSWLLHDCQPAGYKTATDFSATGNAVSLRELTIDCSDVDEIDLSF